MIAQRSALARAAPSGHRAGPRAAQSLPLCRWRVGGAQQQQQQQQQTRPWQRQQQARAATAACRAKDSDGADAGGSGSPSNDFESLFAKELQRRGMESTSSVDEPEAPQASKQEAAQSPPREPFKQAQSSSPFSSSSSSSSTRARPRAPPPQSRIPDETDGQRERSFSIVNEGLEGLLPRGSQLLKLGGSVFLGFLPFMLAFSLLFTGVFAVFGDSFLHSGRAGTGPKYLDPEELLSAPTVDPYVPIQSYRDY